MGIVEQIRNRKDDPHEQEEGGEYPRELWGSHQRLAPPSGREHFDRCRVILAEQLKVKSVLFDLPL